MTQRQKKRAVQSKAKRRTAPPKEGDTVRLTATYTVLAISTSEPRFCVTDEYGYDQWFRTDQIEVVQS